MDEQHTGSNHRRNQVDRSDDGTTEQELDKKFAKKPWGFRWRSNTLFIVVTIGIGIFTDLFLYGLIVPILPFLLRDRMRVPKDVIQDYTSGMLTAYAAASLSISPLAGIIADRTKTRRGPFIGGLIVLLLATLLFFVVDSVPGLIVARIGQGASSAFVWTVGLAMCIDTVGPENLGKTIGSIFSFVTIGELVAPVIGGVLYTASGMLAVGILSLGIIVIDLVMRLLVIEKQTAQQYSNYERQNRTSNDDEEDESSANSRDNGNDEPDENTRLLPNGSDAEEQGAEEDEGVADDDEDDKYYINPDQPKIVRMFPILYCFTNISLVMAQIVALMQALIVASYDATIPIHAKEVYGFDSLKSGLLFIPLGIINCVAGPLAGWAVDRYGTKPVAVVGFLWFTPTLILLRIPQAEPFTSQIILYGCLLALCSIGSPIVGSPSIVESGSVVDKYHKRNPEFFGAKGPYAQLYGISGMMFCTGLSVGPIIAGYLNKTIGYGNMNAVLAGMCFVTAMICYVYFGQRPNPKATVKKIIQRPREGLFKIRSRSSAVFSDRGTAS